MNYPIPIIATPKALPVSVMAGLRVGISSDVEYVFLPQLLTKLRTEMPGVAVSVQTVEPSLIRSMLTTGEIYFGIGPDSSPHPSLESQWLRTGRSTVLRADTIPGALSLKDICSRPHASVSFAVDVDLQINRLLQAHGHQREVFIEIPHFDNLPSVLARTDYLAIVPDYVAEQLVKRGGLRSEIMPFDPAHFKVSMSWQADASADLASRWLRSRCSMILGHQ